MSESSTLAPNPPACVYRYYDADGVLLYVGFTSRGASRTREHAEVADWWQFAASGEVAHYATDSEAREEERRLISEFRPPFNKQHNPDYADVNAAYLRLTQVPPSESGSLAFQERYHALRHALPLEAMSDPDDGTLTLRSREEDEVVARRCHLLAPVPIRLTSPTGSWVRLGMIQAYSHAGPFLYLRGTLGDCRATVSSPVARLVVITLKIPVKARIRSITCQEGGTS